MFVTVGKEWKKKAREDLQPWKAPKWKPFEWAPQEASDWNAFW